MVKIKKDSAGSYSESESESRSSRLDITNIDESDEYDVNLFGEFTPNVVIAGYETDCSVSMHGNIICWGDNEWGQCNL